MDWLSFVSGLVASLAWPISIFAIVKTFQSEIASKIRDAISAQWGDAKITFAEVSLRASRNFPNPEKVRVELSAREREVAVLILAGFTDEQIAEILGLSTNTSRVYRAKLFSATETNSLDALREALARGGKETQRLQS